MDLKIFFLLSFRKKKLIISQILTLYKPILSHSSGERDDCIKYIFSIVPFFSEELFIVVVRAALYLQLRPCFFLCVDYLEDWWRFENFQGRAQRVQGRPQRVWRSVEETQHRLSLGQERESPRMQRLVFR